MPTIFRDVVTLGNPYGPTENQLILNAPPADGIKIGCDLLDGWYDTPEVTAQLNSRGAGDGAYGSPKWPSSERYITIGGWYYADERYQAEIARERLVAFLNPKEFALTRYEVPTAKTLQVRQYGQVAFNNEMENGSRWIATLVAPYPFKESLTGTSLQTFGFTGGEFYRTYPRTYSDPYPNRTYLQVAGAAATDPIVFNNIGTATSLPTFEITGVLESGSWVLVNETTGESLWAYTTISDGQTLTIDTKRMKADQNGYDVSHLIFGEWFGLVPGENVIRLYADNSAAYAKIPSAKSAWK